MTQFYLEESDVKILRDMIAANRRERVDLTAPKRMPRIAAAASKEMAMVKTQEAGTNDGKISVKEVNASGTEIGSAFDVWTNWAKSTSFDMSLYLPKFALTGSVGVVWPIRRIAGEWFLDWQPIPIGTTIQTLAASDDDLAKIIKKMFSTSCP